jgi:SAM-dependent methyltransferase
MSAVQQPPASPPSDPGTEVDPARTVAFSQRLLDDMAGGMAGVLLALGDRLGLLSAVAAAPCTDEELARRARVDRRYARDWLGGLAARGYLDYDPDSRRYCLPPEHAAAVADEGGPFFLGGAFEQLPGLIGAYGKVAEACATGTGVPAEAYGEEMRRAMERTSAGWFEHQLVPQWIPATPGLHDRLARGGDVADLGCGSGRAVIALARAYPRSRFVGFDTFDAALARARANAEEAGVAERVRFEERDVASGLTGQYDLITMFDALHDIARPLDVLRGIRSALSEDGRFLLLEIQSAERPEGNVGPVSTLMYATSVMYCIPTSLAAGADGLGTLGLPEHRVRALCGEAGFSEVRRLPVANPFHALYVATP